MLKNLTKAKRAALRARKVDTSDIPEVGAEGFEKATLRGPGITELLCESIDADGQRCSECGETGPNERLFVYVTKRGARRRTHNGQFCSRFCHDRFHGLRLRV